MVIGAVIALILVAAASYATQVWQHREQRLEVIQREAMRVATAVEQRAARSLATDDLTLLRALDRFADVPWSSIATNIDGWTYLSGLVESQLEIRAIWLVDAEGYVRLSSREFPARPTYVADADYFRVHRLGGEGRSTATGAGGLYAGSHTARRPRGEGHAMILSRPIWGADGQYRGVVGATVTPGRFGDLYHGLGLPTGSLVGLLSFDGQVIVGHPDRYWPARIDLAGGPLDSASLAETANDVFSGYAGDITGNADPAQDSGGTAGELGEREGRQIVAYRRVETFPLVVAVMVPVDSALAPWREKAIWSGVVVVLALGLAVSALVYLGAGLGRRSRSRLDGAGTEGPDSGEADRREVAFKAVGDGWWWYEVASERLNVAPEWVEAMGGEVMRADRRGNAAGHGAGLPGRGSWMARIDGRDRVYLREALSDHAAGRTDAVSSEFRMTDRNGSIRWLWARGRVVARDKNGELAAIAGTVIDVTERMEGTGGLAQRYEDMCEVQRVLGLGYWSWFVDSERLQWSDVLFRSTGIEPTADGTLSAAQFRSMVHPNDRDMVRESLLSALKGGREALRFRILRADGAVRHLHGTAIAVSDRSGERTVRLVGAIQDVTEQVMALRSATTDSVLFDTGNAPASDEPINGDL